MTTQELEALPINPCSWRRVVDRVELGITHERAEQNKSELLCCTDDDYALIADSMGRYWSTGTTVDGRKMRESMDWPLL